MTTVRVEPADALTRATDLLVLKYAQRFYGVDHAAAQRINADRLRPSAMPGVGESIRFDSPDALGAKQLVFLGVESLDLFGYPEIRRFGYRAVAAAGPGVREMCLTLHGTGYGLDEAEAFRSEMAGVFDAFDDGAGGPDLQYVTLLEYDAAAVDRLKDLLREILDARGNRGLPTSTPHDARFDRAGLASARKRHAFVAMPFADEFSDYFHYGIRPPLTDAGLLCERMDELHYTGDVVSMMAKRIREAELVVADLSGANPNVYLEVGYAWAADRPTILLCDERAEPLFDVRGHRYLRYASIRDLEKKLRTEVDGLGLGPGDR